jgi:hypothetical protein
MSTALDTSILSPVWSLAPSADDVWQLAATSFAPRMPFAGAGSGGGSPKRLLPDFVIASHALLKADRLMTRDASRYALDFPSLRLI